MSETGSKLSRFLSRTSLLVTCFAAASFDIAAQVSSTRPPAPAQTPMLAPPVSALRSLDQASSQLVELQRIHDKRTALNLDLARSFDEMNAVASQAVARARQGGPSQPALADRVNALQMKQRALAERARALQEQMQTESRQFAMISNIMKSQHDAAKSAINNMR